MTPSAVQTRLVTVMCYSWLYTRCVLASNGEMKSIYLATIKIPPEPIFVGEKTSRVRYYNRLDCPRFTSSTVKRKVVICDIRNPQRASNAQTRSSIHGHISMALRSKRYIH